MPSLKRPLHRVRINVDQGKDKIMSLDTIGMSVALTRKNPMN